MLQAVGDVREGFICPQCHQDMSTMEMLQVHFQDIHMKQSSSTVKGLFSFAKQKIKSVQDNFTNIPNEQTNNYAQYFSSDQNDSSSKPQQIGYIRSYTDRFKKERKAQHDQISIETTRLLLRIEKLISTGENIPKNANTKERRKYEQDIVEWIDDAKVTLCPSCAKSFNLSRRKHHCRLDGFVICDPCSRFLLFSKARYLIEPSTSSSLPNGLSLQRSNSLTSLNSTTADNSAYKDRTNNEDYLRICLSCQKVLQRRYDQICFKNTQRDEVFVSYEKIVEAKKILDEIHSTYSTMIESLLNGDTKYQIVDAQKLYRQLSTCYDKIDSTSKHISKLADSCLNIDEDDTQSIIRYSALCRNMRMYAIHVLQNFAISTRRVPSEEDVKRAREERKRLIEERIESERAAKAELASRIPLTDSPTVKKKEVSGWRPTIDRNLLVQAQELNPLVQQVYQVTEYIRQAQIAGRLDEVESLKLNLKELEQALNHAQQQENVSTFDS